MKNISEKVTNGALVAVLAISALFVIAIIVCIAVAGSARYSRTMSNDLNRTFTVYDYNGDKVFEDSGKLDCVYEDGKWYYDKDGKRTSTSGGIVIVQEVSE